MIVQYRQFYIQGDDNIKNYVHEWLPDRRDAVKGLVQIVHGMGEHALRYQHFAKALTDNGYATYALDHRGHGLTGKATNTLGYLGPDGFHRLVENVDVLFTHMQAAFPEIPMCLFGHSMGSFVAQRYLQVHGERINGVILSGSNGKLSPMVNFGIFLAKRIAKRRGETFQSKILDQLSFGSYNKKFQPNRTGFDWLSREAAEVDKYIQDPLCGAVLAAGSFRDFLQGLKAIQKPSALRAIPKQLPIYILSGDQDPVGEFGQGVVALANLYKKYSIEHVEYKLYKESRHEILNETDREQVEQDVISWLNQR
jgi:alpha-beta hydrolase superfamily lysophospholipase